MPVGIPRCPGFYLGAGFVRALEAEKLKETLTLAHISENIAALARLYSVCENQFESQPSHCLRPLSGRARPRPVPLPNPPPLPIRAPNPPPGRDSPTRRSKPTSARLSPSR